MGVLIDLAARARSARSRSTVARPGATAAAARRHSRPGRQRSDGDKQIVATATSRSAAEGRSPAPRRAPTATRRARSATCWSGSPSCRRTATVEYRISSQGDHRLACSDPAAEPLLDTGASRGGAADDARRRRRAAARPRRRRPRRLRRAGPPAPRPAVGGGPAHPRRPRGGGRRPAGRAAVGLPGGRPVPRRLGGHHLAAPHRGQRLPGPDPAPPGPPDRAAARDGRHDRRRRADRGHRARGPRRPWPRCPSSSGPRWCWWTCRATRWPRRPTILGVAEGTVKSRCARGRARLAVLLGYLRNPRPGRNRRRIAGVGQPMRPAAPRRRTEWRVTGRPRPCSPTTSAGRSTAPRTRTRSADLDRDRSGLGRRLHGPGRAPTRSCAAAAGSAAGRAGRADTG